MSVALAKLKGDLRLRRGRALLMALATVVGTAAVTAALVAAITMDRAIPDSFASSLPPDVVLVTGAQTDAALELLTGQPGIIAVEPRRVLRGRIATPDGWASLLLTVLPDMSTQSVSRIATAFTGDSGLLIERSSLTVWGGQAGDPAVLRLPGAGETTMLTAGVVADAAVAPGVQDRVVYVYATPETLGPLGTFDELRLRMEPGALPRVINELAGAGITPSRIEEPLKRHPHADQMQAVMVLLIAFAVAALAVAAALVGNLVAVALRSEGRLIGIQKTIGATARRVVWMTLAGVAVIAVPAAVVGVALGLFAAGQFLAFAAHELNLADLSLAPAPMAVGLAFMIGILAPMTASWLVARRAARVAPLAAISPDRDHAGPGRAAAGGASVARALAGRHLGRAPGRLALMLLALSLGGAAVLSAGTVYRSLSGAVDRVFSYRADDLDIRLLTPASAAILTEAASVDGVEAFEVWGFLTVALAGEDNRVTGSRFGLLAPPEDTKMLRLPMAEGRWLGGPSAMEVVAARSLLARYPSLAVGSDVTLARGEARVAAQIVGAIEEATDPGLYATQGVHDALAGATGFGGALRLETGEDPAPVAARVENRLFASGLIPIFVFDRAELQFATREHFVILLILLSTVGAAALLVGGLALWSSITIAITERAREVSVIRAIGADNGLVLRLFGAESAVLAVIALALSVAIALPLSAALAGMLGQGTLSIAVPLRFSWTALAMWLAVLVVIVALATWMPLRRALAIPAAQALRYE